MAVTAREILLIFRGQNYMSQAIRRVGADVGGLSRGTQLANQRQQLQISGQRLRNTRANAAAELASIQSGSRSIAMQQRRNALTKSEFNNAQALRRNYEQQLGVQENLLKNQNAQSMLQRRINSSSLAKGQFGGMTQAELKKAYEGALIAQQRLESSAVTLRRQEELLTAAMTDQSLAAKKVAADEAELYLRQAQLTSQINNTTRALELNTSKLVQNAKAIQLNKYENFANIAGKVEHAGRAVQMFGLIAAAAMGYAADKAAQFNTQVTIAATKVKQPGMGVPQIAQNAQLLQQRLIDQLAAGTVASPTDLTQAAYRTLSGLRLPGNVQGIKDATNLVKQFGNVVKANFGMTDLTQVTNGAILAINDFQIPLKQVPKLLNTMQAAEKYGRMTMGEFIATFNQAAPAARAANYSFKQMAGTIAFLSTKMTTAPAATGYARLLQTLAQNAQKFNQAGYQVTDKSGKNLLPIDEIIKNITTKNPQLAKGGVFLQNFFKQVTGQTGYLQARKVFVFLAQDLAGLDKITKQVAGDSKVLDTTALASGQSAGVKWAEFKNQMQAVLLVLGAGAIPAFKAFAAPLIAAVKWFSRLNPDTQKFIGYVITMVAVLATLGGTLAAVGGGLARMGAILVATMGSRGLGGLAAEEGAVTAGSSLLIGGLLTLSIIVIPLAAHFHQLGNVMQIVGVLMLTLTIRSIALKAALITTTAVAAGSGSTALLGMAGSAAVLVGQLALVAAGTFVAYKAFSTLDSYIPGHPLNKAGSWAGRTLFNSFGNTFDGRGSHGEAIYYVPGKGWVTKSEYDQWQSKNNPLAGVRNIPAPLTPPVGSSSAVMKKYHEQLKIWERIQKYWNNLDTKTNKKNFLDKATKAAKKFGTTATESFQKAYAAYKKTLDISKADPSNLEKQIATQNALTRLKAIANKQQLAASLKAANAATTTKTTFRDTLSSIRDMYNNFLQTEQGLFGTLFQGPFMNSPIMQNYTQWGGKPTGQQLTKDLSSQINQFKKFHNDINQLTKRGAPAQLIQQLMNLGPSALPQIKALMSLSTAGLNNYFSLFRKSQNMIQKETMSDLNKQLAQYRKFGQHIALAIVAGLQDQNVALTNELKKLIHSVFPSLGGRHHHTVPQPPTTHHHRASTTHTDRNGRRFSSSSTGDTHYHYHVVAPADSSIDTQIRHAAFRQKSKHSPSSFSGNRYE